MDGFDSQGKVARLSYASAHAVQVCALAMPLNPNSHTRIKNDDGLHPSRAHWSKKEKRKKKKSAYLPNALQQSMHR